MKQKYNKTLLSHERRYQKKLVKSLNEFVILEPHIAFSWLHILLLTSQLPIQSAAAEIGYSSPQPPNDDHAHNTTSIDTLNKTAVTTKYLGSIPQKHNQRRAAAHLQFSIHRQTPGRNVRKKLSQDAIAKSAHKHLLSRNLEFSRKAFDTIIKLDIDTLGKSSRGPIAFENTEKGFEFIITGKDNLRATYATGVNGEIDKLNKYLFATGLSLQFEIRKTLTDAVEMLDIENFQRGIPFIKLLIQMLSTHQCIATFQTGNCGHHALAAVLSLVKDGVHKIDRVELVSTKGRVIHHVEGEIPLSHSFVVIGRSIRSKLNDPATWGNRAVICDPWNGMYYPAQNLVTHPNTPNHILYQLNEYKHVSTQEFNAPVFKHPKDGFVKRFNKVVAKILKMQPKCSTYEEAEEKIQAMMRK